MTFGEWMDELRAAADDFESQQVDENQIGGDDDVEPDVTLDEFIRLLKDRFSEVE